MAGPETIKSTRLFPSERCEEKTVPLSILDATVARFSPTGAIWLYDALPADVTEADFIDRLQRSLSETLNLFPQWAGQLQWAPVKPGGKHTERFNRPIVIFGSASDPGVEWTVVRHAVDIASLAPTPTERALPSGVWMGDAFPQAALLSPSALALGNLRDCTGLPGMTVQLNLFPGGGYAIGTRVAHPLADAHSLLLFAQRWAAASRAWFDHPPSTAEADLLEPLVFDPSLLDARAAGDLDDAGAPDPALRAAARALPLHRFDWWDVDAPGYPAALRATTAHSVPPPSPSSSALVEPETRAPWHTWDLARPVSFAVLHFPAAELQRLKAGALATDPSCHGVAISRLDALLAHLRAAVQAARSGDHQGPDDTASADAVCLDVTLDARRRVAPPLPAGFVGSPLVVAHVGGGGDAATAGALRRALARFTPGAVAALLHDAAFAPSPQRLWQAFLGPTHLLATSWLRLPLYGVDFVGGGTRPRYVHAVMSKMDGIVQVMDAVLGDGGVDVALYLEKEAMGRLLGGERLRRFRD
ncbi:transferase family protein [Xylariomycetidae sp. FL0641]|nr:transferase family protein [Xylariomycetidae sp. FL0641]